MARTRRTRRIRPGAAEWDAARPTSFWRAAAPGALFAGLLIAAAAAEVALRNRRNATPPPPETPNETGQ